MCDYGSDDNTYNIVCEYIENHPQFKIKLIKRDNNIGLNKTLNDCMKEAKGNLLQWADLLLRAA